MPDPDKDQQLDEFLAAQQEGPEALDELNRAVSASPLVPHTPFSRPPKGARQGALIVCIALIVIWAAIYAVQYFFMN